MVTIKEYGRNYNHFLVENFLGIISQTKRSSIPQISK